MKSSDAYDTNNDDRPIEIADGFFIPFLRNADRYDGHRRITRVNNDAPLTSRFPYLTTAGDRLSKSGGGGGKFSLDHVGPVRLVHAYTCADSEQFSVG